MFLFWQKKRGARCRLTWIQQGEFFAFVLSRIEATAEDAGHSWSEQAAQAEQTVCFPLKLHKYIVRVYLIYIGYMCDVQSLYL